MMSRASSPVVELAVDGSLPVPLLLLTDLPDETLVLLTSFLPAREVDRTCAVLLGSHGATRRGAMSAAAIGHVCYSS